MFPLKIHRFSANFMQVDARASKQQRLALEQKLQGEYDTLQQQVHQEIEHFSKLKAGQGEY